MPTPDTDHTTLGAVLAAIAGFGLWLRRKWSADSKAIQEDTTGRNYITGLEQELATSRETSERLAKERNTLAEEVGGLRATVEMLRKVTEAQEVRIKKLEKLLGFDLDTNPGEFDER